MLTDAIAWFAVACRTLPAKSNGNLTNQASQKAWIRIRELPSKSKTIFYSWLERALTH